MSDAPWRGGAHIEVLYADEHVVVVNKPSGMLVHRGQASDRVVAMTIVRDLVGRHTYPAHRLDRGTSGALMLALTPEHAATLQGQLGAHTVDKVYLALVRGIPPAEGQIDHAIQRGDREGPRVPASSRFRRLASVHDPGRYSLVEVQTYTGRRHQVRRHMKHISHPLIGDVRYGKGPHNRLFRERYGLHRLALHAALLAFDHPTTGARVIVEAPLPADLAGPLEALGMREALATLALTPPRGHTASSDGRGHSGS